MITYPNCYYHGIMWHWSTPVRRQCVSILHTPAHKYCPGPLQVGETDARSPAEKDRAAKAKGVCRWLRKRSVVLFGLFLQDVLKALAHLSMDFQKTESSVYQCHIQISAARTTLLKLAQGWVFNSMPKIMLTNLFDGLKQKRCHCPGTYNALPMKFLCIKTQSHHMFE